jgi:hypothetical protein
MQNKFVINDSSKDMLQGKTLLLDTNVLMDAYRLPAEFYELLQELVGLDCDIVTTKTIVIEFLGSTTDEDALSKKTDFLEMILGKRLESGYLPIDRDFPNRTDFLTFSRATNKFHPADFELYLTLKKYRQHLLLITRNHKDFPTKLVNRISFITLLGNAEIHTYGVYSLE